MKRQKVSNAASLASAKVIIKRKIEYDVTPMNRAKILRTEENQGMELDVAEKGGKGMNEVD